MPTSIGARVRYQLDRESEQFEDVYKQRTATERVNSQALEPGLFKELTQVTVTSDLLARGRHLTTISYRFCAEQGDCHLARARTLKSPALELGIERPKLRNGRAIANQNTLIYVLINLRALQRIRAHKGEATVALS